MRRLVLVNALIFAVLAAAIALVFYGFTYSDTSREREKQLMKAWLDEKVVGLESTIVNNDNKLLKSGLSLNELVGKLAEVATVARVRSAIVLDEDKKLIPGGYVGPLQRRDSKEARVFEEWFERVVLPTLPLDRNPVGERGHLHRDWDGKGKSYLFSFVKQVEGDKTYYIVAEDDLSSIHTALIPQYFERMDTGSHVIYHVFDATGRFWQGPNVEPPAHALRWVEPFHETLDGWYVRISERDDSVYKELVRKRLVYSIFLAVSSFVLLTGLGVLVLAIRRERRANELKSEFISNVSHELKTPLSIISMFGEMLAKGRTKGPEQANEYAEIIWRESVRLGRLIDNVLDFAKIERGMGVYEFEESNIAEVVERVVELVGRRLANAEMTIDVAIDPDLPLVKLDANAFTLAVMNLIDNATKYAADGKRIELTLGREGERIVLTVRDFGPGIAAEEHEHIFERFYRARAVRLKPIRGSGIGLALVRHIVRAHHGDVQVISEPGKGATFRLWLPI